MPRWPDSTTEQVMQTFDGVPSERLSREDIMLLEQRVRLRKMWASIAFMAGGGILVVGGAAVAYGLAGALLSIGIVFLLIGVLLGLT